jgi:hypothetical protein
MGGKSRQGFILPTVYGAASHCWPPSNLLQLHEGAAHGRSLASEDIILRRSGADIAIRRRTTAEMPTMCSCSRACPRASTAIAKWECGVF